MEKRSLLTGLGVAAAGVLVYIFAVQVGREPSPPPATDGRQPPPGEMATVPGTADPAAMNVATTPPPPPPEIKAAPEPVAAPPLSRPRDPDPRIKTVGDKIHMNDPINLTRSMHSPRTSPEDDVAALGNAVQYYQLIYKENPVGSVNEEIIAQLTGNNPKKIVIIPPDHPDINGRGQLVDRWGTPYFFHGLTSKQMDVWSAGPDQEFGSSDDVKLGADSGMGDTLGLTLED